MVLPVPPRTTALPLAAVLAGLVLPLAGTPAAAATPCTTTPTVGYTVQVCVTVPDGVLSGTAPVSSTVAVWPAAGASAPGVKRVTFSWRGGYLLSDHDADGSGRWSMQWRTDRLVDSTGSLVARALLTDGTTYTASVPTAVYNGGQAPFVSGRRFAVSPGTTPEPGKPFRLVAVGDGADGVDPRGRGRVADRVVAAEPARLPRRRLRVGVALRVRQLVLVTRRLRPVPRHHQPGPRQPRVPHAGRCRLLRLLGPEHAALLQLRRGRLARCRLRLHRPLRPAAARDAAVRLAGRRPGRQPGALHDRLLPPPPLLDLRAQGQDRAVGGRGCSPTAGSPSRSPATRTPTSGGPLWTATGCRASVA